MELQVTEYPDPSYQPFDRELLLRSFAARILFWAFELFHFLTIAILVTVFMLLALLVGVLLGLSNLVWIFSVLTFVFLVGAVIGNKKLKILVPFRCPNCGRFIHRESIETGKFATVFYACHECKIYVDTGITEGD